MKTLLLLVFLHSQLLSMTIGHSTRRASQPVTGAEEEIEENDSVYVEVNGERVNSTIRDGTHAPHITLYVTYKMITYAIDLSMNTYLLSPKYIEKIITRDEAVFRYVNQSEELCYYLGKVKGFVQSSAAFSTCDRIKGFFVLNNATIYVDPVQVDHSSPQGLYQIKKVIDDNLSRWVCGTKDIKNQFYENNQIRQQMEEQIVLESLEGKLVIELYVANDYMRYKEYGGDLQQLARNTREIVNTVNLLYQPVGFFVVLVGLEMWQVDQFEVNAESGITLNNWNRYRILYIVEKHHHDAGFLISGQTFLDRVLGLANVATMCSTRSSGGLIKDMPDNSAISGALMAHELGHTFGLSHDNDNCFCASSDISCIMSPEASIVKPALYFSSCSQSQLISAVNKGFDICLKNMPTDLSQSVSLCGNGILEDGEECDCGRMSLEECSTSCCNNTMCELIGSAQCASGGCCDLDTCQLRTPGSECRQAAGSCDLPEYCKGQSAFCPSDVFKHDGLNCSVEGNDSYCWDGLCQNQRSRCREIFGPSSSESDIACYTVWNVHESLNGYCGITIGQTENYTKCDPEDVMCGAIQCDPASSTIYRYTNYIYRTSKTAGSNHCFGIILDYGLEVENPGLVPNGSPCGTEMMCVSQRCVGVQSVLKTTPCPQCLNGVCNSKGHCHCDVGYQGPTCGETGGPGGSEDSGLIPETTTTKTWSPSTVTTITTTDPWLPTTTTNKQWRRTTPFKTITAGLFSPKTTWLTPTKMVDLMPSTSGEFSLAPATITNSTTLQPYVTSTRSSAATLPTSTMLALLVIVKIEHWLRPGQP